MQRIMRGETEKKGMKYVEEQIKPFARGHPNENKSSKKLIELIQRLLVNYNLN